MFMKIYVQSCWEDCIMCVNCKELYAINIMKCYAYLITTSKRQALVLNVKLPSFPINKFLCSSSFILVRSPPTNTSAITRVRKTTIVMHDFFWQVTCPCRSWYLVSVSSGRWESVSITKINSQYKERPITFKNEAKIQFLNQKRI